MSPRMRVLTSFQSKSEDKRRRINGYSKEVQRGHSYNMGRPVGSVLEDKPAGTEETAAEDGAGVYREAYSNALGGHRVTSAFRNITEGQEQRVKRLTKEGLSASIIAERLGLSWAQVYRYQIRAGLRKSRIVK